MKNITSATLLMFLFPAVVATAQTPPTASGLSRQSEMLFGELEEIAMCHHAIRAAYHDGVALNQNPYYRYILNAPQKGRGANVYPIPERCKTLETKWVLDYTELSPDTKVPQDKMVRDAIEMTISDIAADAQFLTVVINKMALEGEKAVMWDGRDKDIP